MARPEIILEITPVVAVNEWCWKLLVTYGVNTPVTPEQKAITN
jgi:hypothetical protein